MSANNLPIFSRIADIQWAADSTDALIGLSGQQNTALTGAGTLGTDIFTVFTADATNGGRAEKAVIRHGGTNIQTVVRLFLNNGNTNATLTNNVLIAEATVEANTISQTAQSIPVEIPLGMSLPPGYRILATVGTAIAAGVAVSILGGKY